MKHTSSLMFIISVIILLGWNCSKHTTIISQEGEVLTSDTFSFLTKPVVSSSSQDSLYEFYQRIELYPDQVHHNKFGEILWNSVAEQFISGTWISIFSKRLELVSQSNQIEQSVNFTFKNLPVVVIGSSNQILFYNLEKRRVIKKYHVKGTPFRYTALPDNKLKVLVSNDFKDSLFVYHFRVDTLLGLDTINIKYNTNLATLHPDGSVLIDGNPVELKFINIPDLSVSNTLQLAQQCSRIALSSDGSRLILINESFNTGVLSTIKILSFPNLEEIGNYSFNHKLVYSLQNDLFLAGDEEGNIQLINIKTGETIYSAKENQQISSLGILSNREVLLGIYSSQREEIQLIYRDVLTGKNLHTLNTSSEYILPIAFSSDSRKLFFYENKTLSQIELERGANQIVA